MDEQSGEGREDVGDAPETRWSWFAKQLGEEWTEVEPGIYRFVGGDSHPAGEPETDAVERAEGEDLLDALQPAAPELDPEPPPKPAWRRLGRRAS